MTSQKDQCEKKHNQTNLIELYQCHDNKAKYGHRSYQDYTIQHNKYPAYFCNHISLSGNNILLAHHISNIIDNRIPFFPATQKLMSSIKNKKKILLGKSVTNQGANN